ncbi:unnamed protein product [Adineta steineri]|uniref:Nuclear receptor domain-containing protein n=1 Tax=Adineta steineri TaxID=433720 RepID=A0A816FUZ7_9BILA|nr:unnamed protein product [Adineta steineri]CAF1665853.1 unnamed protein product [Adineta steineri]
MHKNYVHLENDQWISIKRSSSTQSSTELDKTKSGSTAKRYKLTLICDVCDAVAHGYNFDAITCESCKAFFRRNGLQLHKLKCRRNNGHCNVRFNIKKRCKRCRLEKCIKTGMRKGWIRTDNEREEKRVKIEENRRLKQVQNNQRSNKNHLKIDDHLSLDVSSLSNNHSYLNQFDWLRIRVIQDYYTEAVKLNEVTGIPSYPSTQSIKSTLELFHMPIYITSMRLISYIKQIDEFRQLRQEDQVYLVKLNLLSLCFFHSIFIYDPRTDLYYEPNTNDSFFSGKDWSRTLNKQFHLEMKQLRNDIIDIFQLDDVIIKLFLLIFIFSNQNSLNQSFECVLININVLDIFKAQNIFIDLAYKYCLDRYGFQKTSILFSKSIYKIMKIQQLVDEVKYTIDNYIDRRQLTSLMQCLLT